MRDHPRDVQRSLLHQYVLKSTAPQLRGRADIAVQRQLNASTLPWTIYYSGGYWENMQYLNLVQPATDATGSIKIALPWPDAIKQQFTSIKTIGAFVKAIFDDRARFLRELKLTRPSPPPR